MNAAPDTFVSVLGGHMRTWMLVLALMGCSGPDTDGTDGVDTGQVDTDTDVEDTGDTDMPEPAVDLEGRWVVPDFALLPGQADRLWCEDAEVGDYNDETWLETGEPVECFEPGSAGGCYQDIEFEPGGVAVRHVRYSARGPCPYDGTPRSVVAWEPWGDWALVDTDGETDTYLVHGQEWSIYELGDFIVVNVDGTREFSLQRGTGRHFQAD